MRHVAVFLIGWLCGVGGRQLVLEWEARQVVPGDSGAGAWCTISRHRFRCFETLEEALAAADPVGIET